MPTIVDETLAVHDDVDDLIEGLWDDGALTFVCGDSDAVDLWIVIGEDQSNTVAGCNPEDAAVYTISSEALYEGCALDGLDVIADKKVVVFLDGDASTDRDVFDRGQHLARLCAGEGPASFSFSWLATTLDEHLSGYSIEDQRKRLCRAGSTNKGKKPAHAAPKGLTPAQKASRAKMSRFENKAREEGRALIDVNSDRRLVVDELVKALSSGPDSDRIFDFGGVLATVVPDEETGITSTLRLRDQDLLNMLASCAQMISMTTQGVNSAWPEDKTLTALYGKRREFRHLRGISQSPIVRADNTIAATDGYDAASEVLLDLGGLNLEIPDDPTDDEVLAAVSLILDDWLGDFPFASTSDKANMLALILTFPLRDIVGLVPFAVISAKSMGTGKSKLISLVVYLFTRVMPEFDSLSGSDEAERRKKITSLLLKAPSFIVFDETPEIGGPTLNRLATAHTWSDRILGGNEQAVLPNRAVMAFTGNNVQVLGDTSRRYYPIELFFDGEHPENRSAAEFKHSDLESWTDEHRGELLTAVFTIIRAWQVAGCQKRAASFGSFERWDSIIGGIISNAGVPGFLGNLAEHRETSNFDESLWIAHCKWLAWNFPTGEFTTRDVIKKMVSSHPNNSNIRAVNPNAELPPDIDTSPLDPIYPRKLGRLYRDRLDAWHGGFRLTKSDMKAGGNKTRWGIEVSDQLLRDDPHLAQCLYKNSPLEAPTDQTQQAAETGAV